VSCQASCQESSYATCKSELASSCTTQCNESVGAIFCDGNYIGASDVAQCVTALNAVLTAKIDATASGSCSGNDCSGTATVKTTSCAASPGKPANVPFWAFGAVVVGVVARIRRRRSRA